MQVLYNIKYKFTKLIVVVAYRGLRVYTLKNKRPIWVYSSMVELVLVKT